MHKWTAQHPARRAMYEQGREMGWVARQLEMSPNYLYRILRLPGQDHWRKAPAGFYARLSLLLGVPEESLTPDEPIAA